MYQTLSDLIRRRCRDLGITSCAQLHTLMRKQCRAPLSYAAVHKWWDGSGGIDGANLEHLLDVLSIYDTGQRERAHRMVGAPAAKDLRPVMAPSADEVSA